MTSEDHTRDDGCSDEGCDAIDWQGSFETRHTCHEVAHEGKTSTGEHGGWHENAVVARLEEGTAQVGHSHSDEHDGTAIGGDDGDEDARTTDDQKTGTFEVQTEVAGIVIA